MSLSTRMALLALHVAATFLAFPHSVGGEVLDLGFLFAWAVPLTAAAAVAGLAPRRALAVGFLAGLLAQGSVLSWAYVVTVHYGHAPVVVGLLAPFGMAAYGATFQAVWSMGFAWLASRAAAPFPDGVAAAGIGGPFLLAALWAFLDYTRSFVLSGFTWGSLGYAQHQGPLMALAPWTGVVGLAFVTVLGAFGLLAILWPSRAQGWGLGSRRAGTAALAVTLVMGVSARLVWKLPPGGDAVPVAVLQGNIEQGVKWSPDWADRTLAIYSELSRRAAAQGARVIAWPETAVPGSPDGDVELRERLVDLARETGATLVVGAIGVEFVSGRDEPLLFDSAFVVTGEGVMDRYDKSHLVPFGEYLPLRPLLGQFIRAIATGSAGRDVTAGQRPRSLDIPIGDRMVRVGLPICYELLFPDLMRRFAADGGQVLFAITNDAWYGRTGAPYQFLAITEMRAAESGVWIARAANTGVSARIDGRGRVREQTAIFETDLLVGSIPLHRGIGQGESTFFVRHGEVFAWCCGGFVLLYGVNARRGSRRNQDE